MTLALPEIRKIESIDAKGATIVCASGFEERTLALSQCLDEGSAHHAVVLIYRNWHEKNRTQEVVEGYSRRGIQVDQIEYDRFLPDSFGDALVTLLKQKAATSVLLDISTMSKMAILLSLEICREMNLETRLFYAEAAEYGPTEEQYLAAKRNPEFLRPSIQVYSGVAGLIRASRLSSVAMQGEPTAAIAFMSMNEMLTQALLNSIYPSRLFLINGRPPILRWRECATAWIHDPLIQEWGEADNPLKMTPEGETLPTRSTSTLQYSETVEAIRELYWRLALSYRIVLAPTGAKMQTVGAFIARAIHPDIHIEYPTPKGFLDFYSRGVASKWLVCFGQLGDLVNHLREVDIREHLTIAG